MNRAHTTQPFYTLFLLFLIALYPTLHADNGQEAHQRLKILLAERPDLAEKFLKRVSTKKGEKQQPTLKSAPTPESKPVIVPAPKPIPEPEMKAELPKPWMTENDTAELNSIFTVIESNTRGVYACLDAFFNKANMQPYATHVACLQKQIAYLRDNLLSKFPKADTPERESLFITFHNLTRIIEQAEIALMGILQPKPAGLIDFNRKYTALKPILASLQKQANRQMDTIKQLIKPNMASRLNTLKGAVNRMFSFADTVNKLQIPFLIPHRLKS